MASRDVSYYRKLPYRRMVEPRIDSTGEAYFIARLAEIPSLRIDGVSREEALLKLDQMFDEFILGLIEMGDEVPEPELWPGATSPDVGRETGISLPVSTTVDKTSFDLEPAPWSVDDPSEREFAVA